ncbi:hypothetical protein S2091_1096 [Solimicrobium silvestre]|uniref:Uncharacterized protein n=1 Tax=Solimicrobium silvestre TaxID=2099400 RepID=A0A2S9H3B3_9BURK|nr:hypothetical protein S2091_1096 [Solimicrobium silvestre]
MTACYPGHAEAIRSKVSPNSWNHLHHVAGDKSVDVSPFLDEGRLLPNDSPHYNNAFNGFATSYFYYSVLREAQDWQGLAVPW